MSKPMPPPVEEADVRVAALALPADPDAVLIPHLARGLTAIG